MQEKLQKLLFYCYLISLVWILLFKMSISGDDLRAIMGTRYLNLIPFGEPAKVNGTFNWTEVINNCLIFLPFGGLLSIISNRTFGKKILLIVLFSIIIECLQYLLQLGRTDITDVLTNSLGGVIGLLAYSGLNNIFEKKKLDIVLTYIGGILFICTLLFIAILIVSNL